MKLRQLVVVLLALSLIQGCYRAVPQTKECPVAPIESLPIEEVTETTAPIEKETSFAEKKEFLQMIDETLAKLPSLGGKAEQNISLLKKFRNSLENASSEAALYQTLSSDKQIKINATKDVLFTGYYKPLFKGSKTRSKKYSAPLYSMPKGIGSLPRKNLLSGQTLRSHELVYLKDPFEAYLAEIQGSVGILTDSGKVLHYAFAGSNNLGYVSIGSELVKDKKLTKTEATIPGIRGFFDKHPELRQHYINRNPRFVFFRESKGKTLGSSGVELIPERAVATDRSVYAPGSVLLVKVRVPSKDKEGNWAEREISKFVIALDSGSAIIGPRRIDLYLGEGQSIGEVAGRLNSRGSVYQLTMN
jgi:membrane-bound lytic murein transglycosylase A